MTSPEKKAKTSNSNDEDVTMPPKEEAPKAPEPPKELEEDAKLDKRPTIKSPVAILTPDTTLNVAVSTVGNMLLPLSEGGLRYLVAGARANIGIKSGRYMFEAKIMEQLSFSDGYQLSQFRIGLSTAASSLLLGDESVCFDMDGSFIASGKKTPCSKKFGTDVMASLVLNLEDGHANCNTVSLFLDGIRASQPQALPDSMKGKALFPSLSFRNVVVHFNFGPSPVMPLPFKCKMLSDAASQDASLTKYDIPKDGKYEVIFPVGLPDEGCFDYLDLFLAKNPQYAEISDRAIVAWGEKSGLARKNANRLSSKDKPLPNFGIPALDDSSTKSVLHQLASVQERHMVVMEVKGGLLKEERAALLAKFARNPALKTVAKVIVGEPPADFKANTLEMTLKVKQEASDKEFRFKKAEEKRIKEIEKRRKFIEKRKAKLEKQAKKKMEEAKKKAEAAKKAREDEVTKKKQELEKSQKVAAAKAKAKAEGVEYKPEEEKEEPKEKEEEAAKEETETKEDPEEEKKEEPEEDEEEEEPEKEEPEEEDEDPPKVALTPEEKKTWFFKSPTPDLLPWDFSTNFTKFSLPEKEDGFDEVVYDWTKTGSKCESYLKEWILEKKKTTRIDNLEPSQWFWQKWKHWQQTEQLWKNKANEYKSLVAKRTAEKLQKATKKALEKAAAEKKAAEDAKKKDEADKKEDTDEKNEEADDKEKAMEVEEEEEEKEVDFNAVDIFGVEDVCDMGGKMPLFKEFQFEDWAIMTLSYELSLLVHAFSRDAKDPERPGMPLDHLLFYYNKYYKKTVSPKTYGVDSIKDLVGLVKEAVFVTKTGTLGSHLPEEMESLGALVMLTEEARRNRSLLVDMGNEKAKLNIVHVDISRRPKRNFQEVEGYPKGGKNSGKGFRFALKTATRLKYSHTQGDAGKPSQKGNQGQKGDAKGRSKGGYKSSKDHRKGHSKGRGKHFGKSAGKDGSKDSGKDGGKGTGKAGTKSGGKRGVLQPRSKSKGAAAKGRVKGSVPPWKRVWSTISKGSAKGNGKGRPRLISKAKAGVVKPREMAPRVVAPRVVPAPGR